MNDMSYPKIVRVIAPDPEIVRVLAQGPPGSPGATNYKDGREFFVNPGNEDNAAVIQTGLNQCAAEGRALFIADGIYKVSAQLIIPQGASLILSDQTVLSATGAMNALVQSNPSGSFVGPLIMGGTLACNNLADRGIDGVMLNNVRIERMVITDAKVNAIHLGRSGGGRSGGVRMNNVHIYRTMPNPGGTSGIYSENTGDSEIETSVIRSVDYGMDGNWWDCKISHVHVWGQPIANGGMGEPIVGFRNGGGDTIYSQCQVDGPVRQAGWDIQLRTVLLGCATNNLPISAGGNDSVATCVQCNATTAVIGCSFKGYDPTARWLNDITGNRFQVTAFGNRNIHVVNTFGSNSALEMQFWGDVIRDGPVGNRKIKYRTQGVDRWQTGATATEETGGNIGSDYSINSYDDVGAFLKSFMYCNRGNGNIGFGTTTPSNNIFMSVIGAVSIRPGLTVVPEGNGDVVFERTNNTTLTIKQKGSDGIVRSVALTMA